ncbi:MAG TPA: hypothetical protein VEK11_07940 [Thermoanaerobaculia bacterium]|nr:hypothetical protein [Thermoanaerobaculia bacterium]
MNRPFALLVLLVFVCLPAAAAPTTAAGLVETYDHPTLGKSSPVSNVTVEIGHMKITLGSGSAAPVMAGDEQLGIYFKGTAAMNTVRPTRSRRRSC